MNFVFFFFSIPPVSLPLPYITIASFSTLPLLFFNFIFIQRNGKTGFEKKMNMTYAGVTVIDKYKYMNPRTQREEERKKERERERERERGRERSKLA